MPSREASGNPGATYRFYFNIGSVDSFERKMEEAQEDMGLPPASWVGPCAEALAALVGLRLTLV